jgi:hypothetical protein
MIYLLQLGSHPVAVVQYTYTRKQYRERHKTNNTQNNTIIRRTTQKICRKTQQLGRVRAVPRLRKFYLGICLTTEEKARKNLSHYKCLQTTFVLTYTCLCCILTTVISLLLYYNKFSVILYQAERRNY